MVLWLVECCSTAVVLLWYCCGTAVVLLWYCCAWYWTFCFSPLIFFSGLTFFFFDGDEVGVFCFPLSGTLSGTSGRRSELGGSLDDARGLGLEDSGERGRGLSLSLRLVELERGMVNDVM